LRGSNVAPGSAEQQVRNEKSNKLTSLLRTLYPIKYRVNGKDIDVYKNDNEVMSWIEAVESDGPKSIRDVKRLVSINDELQLSEEEISCYGLIHDSVKLHDKGETQYQKWFNSANVDKRKAYILNTTANNSQIPVSMQQEDDKFSFVAKCENLSMLSPLAIEFKGGKYKTLISQQMSSLLKCITRC
jgi:DNA uptake protein ComE-like DNA-binding protein